MIILFNMLLDNNLLNNNFFLLLFIAMLSAFIVSTDMVFSEDQCFGKGTEATSTADEGHANDRDEQASIGLVSLSLSLVYGDHCHLVH
jgi:hypothetical protein